MPNAKVFTNIYVSVEHLSLDAGSTSKEGFLSDAALAGVASNIQPTSPEMVALYGGAYGKAYTLFTTASGILETDRLTVSGTNQKFIVKGKQYFGYAVGQHGEYYLEEILS